MNEPADIRISANNAEVKELLEKFAKNQTELKGKGYFNSASGVFGILIYSEEDSTQLIDVFTVVEEKG